MKIHKGVDPAEPDYVLTEKMTDNNLRNPHLQEVDFSMSWMGLQEGLEDWALMVVPLLQPASSMRQHWPCRPSYFWLRIWTTLQILK
jgi:hypothetical protein